MSETKRGWQTYHGYSYPAVLANRPVWALWRRFCCPRGWHLWDEVGSFEDYLACDACDVVFPDAHKPEEEGER